LAGFTSTPFRPKDPAHVVRDNAKNPTNNINKTILLFFIRKPRAKEKTTPDLHDPF